MNTSEAEEVIRTNTDVVYLCVDEARFNKLTSDLDALRRVSARQSLAMATAGHDLRQHLQTILLALDLVRQELLDGEDLEWLATAQEQALCLAKGLENLAEESNISAYTVQHQRTSFPIAKVLGRLSQKWSSVAKAKNLQLRVEQSSARVRSHEELLFVIVDNLVGNAIKYTRRGSVGVYVGVENNALLVAIQDTGPGIAPENLEAIFEPYWRGSDMHVGMGLGLAIVQSTASLLDHPITVNSRVGGGTCFTVRVPLALALSERMSSGGLNTVRIAKTSTCGR